jgi:hypothetical protein
LVIGVWLPDWRWSFTTQFCRIQDLGSGSV